MCEANFSALTAMKTRHRNRLCRDHDIRLRHFFQTSHWLAHEWDAGPSFSLVTTLHWKNFNCFPKLKFLFAVLNMLISKRCPWMDIGPILTTRFIKQSLVGLLISFSGSRDGQDIPKWVVTQRSLGTSILTDSYYTSPSSFPKGWD